MVLTAFLLARGRASILAPTYAEHARAAELAGHNVAEVADVTQLAESRIAIVVNPNNPDGRSSARTPCLRSPSVCGGAAASCWLTRPSWMSAPTA